MSSSLLARAWGVLAACSYCAHRRGMALPESYNGLTRSAPTQSSMRRSVTVLEMGRYEIVIEGEGCRRAIPLVPGAGHFTSVCPFRS